MKEWLIRISLLALGFLIVIICQIFLESYLSEFYPHPKTWKTKGFHQPDPHIGYKGIPGTQKEWEKGAISSRVSINSHGFRDKEYKYEKPPGVFRIVVLGDSMTAGDQVQPEENFTYILEEKLNSEGLGKFEVINLGIPGFGTAQQYLALKHYGLRYRPDLVILAFFPGNDVANNSFILDSELNGKNPHDRDKPFFVIDKDGELKKLPFKSPAEDSADHDQENKKDSYEGIDALGQIFKDSFPNIYYYLVDRVNETYWLGEFLWRAGIKDSKPVLDDYKVNEIPTAYFLYAEEYDPEWKDAWYVTKALIGRMSRQLKAMQIRFLVVVIPWELEFNPDNIRSIERMAECSDLACPEFDLRKPQRLIGDFLKKHNISYLALISDFERYYDDMGEELYFQYIYDNHLNAAGHALASQLIYEKLRDDRLMSAKAKSQQRIP